MTKSEILERIARIEADRSFYEKQGIDVDKLIEAERELLNTTP